MKRVILLTYHGLGHFNACFRIARLLQRNHDVIFAGVEFFNEYVTHQGFAYYSLRTVPFGLGFETWVNTVAKKKFVYWHTLHDRWTNRLYYDRQKELTHMVENLNPDAILIDSLQSTDFIVLYEWLKHRPIRIGFFQTMSSPILRAGQPPINSLALPGERNAIQRGVRNFKWTLRKKWLSQKIMYLGRDDRTIIHNMIRSNNIPDDLIAPYITPKGIVFNNLPEFIMTPEEFEFNDYTPLDFQHHIGFMYDARKEHEAPELKEIARQRHQKKTIVYCSFGSVEYIQAKKVKAFIDKLISALTDSCFLVLALPVNLHHLQPEVVPEHVMLLKHAPQLSILSLADVFITHGGINSIKESIHAGVPMLVYPDDVKYDQRSNSTRVLFHRLGLRGIMEEDTAEDIQKKITELTSNHKYKEALDKMRHIDLSYTDEKFLFLFEGLETLSTIFDTRIPSSTTP